MRTAVLDGLYVLELSSDEDQLRKLARDAVDMAYRIREVLREDIFLPAFPAGPMRNWWVIARKYWTGNVVPDRKERKFIEINDEACHGAVTEDTPIVLDVGTPHLIP